MNRFWIGSPSLFKSLNCCRLKCSPPVIQFQSSSSHWSSWVELRRKEAWVNYFMKWHLIKLSSSSDFLHYKNAFFRVRFVVVSLGSRKVALFWNRVCRCGGWWRCKSMRSLLVNGFKSINWSGMIPLKEESKLENNLRSLKALQSTSKHFRLFQDIEKGLNPFGTI